MVLTPKSNSRLKHIEFVRLEPARALVVLVGEDGQVENRVLTLPSGVPSSALTEATIFSMRGSGAGRWPRRGSNWKPR